MKPALIASIFMVLTSVTAATCASPLTDALDAHSEPLARSADAATQTPVPPPRANPNIKRILQTMDEVSTWGHPDLFGQFAGMRRLFKGEYQGAMKYFKLGARYADKLSQMSIGMMYLHGRGVSKDPAAACAWITIAAERDYPSYVSTRDKVCGTLDRVQHDQATALLKKLLPEYGDQAAKLRMKLVLRAARNALTGSLLGNDIGVRTMATEGHPVNCGGYILNLGGVEVPRRGCGRYDPKLWNSKKYFAARDAQWFGTVSVGVLRKVNAPISGTDKKKTDDSH